MNQTSDSREFPQLEKDLAKAQEDLKKGRFTPLEKLLAQEGFVPHVSNRPQPKSGQRAHQNWSYRLIYQVMESQSLVLVVRLGHRREVYTGLPVRMA